MMKFRPPLLASPQRFITPQFYFALTVALLCLAPALMAANMTPISVTGFNWDVVIENTAVGPPFTAYASELNPGEGNAFYQSGLPGYGFGMPASGNFTSAVGDGTVFQLEPYTGNNALVMSTDTGVTEGTLTLNTPQMYSRIAVIANSASGGGPGAMTLNFDDGTSFVTNYNAPDWFNNAVFALQGTERINVNSGAVSGNPGNPRFYQTSIDLAGTLGATNKTLVSITFDQASAGRSTGIYAVSGEVAALIPATIVSNPTNTSVNELNSVTFSAVAGGNPFPSLQWYRSGTAIPGATGLSYTIAATALTDNGATFRLVASNMVNSVSYVVTSSVATLTVIADTTPPVLLVANSGGLAQVIAGFSERIKNSTATNRANYSIVGTNGSLFINSANLDASQSNIVLSVAPMIDGATYTLTVNNLTDQSAAANVIAPNSQSVFIASVYTPVAIGGPTPTGGQVPAGNGLNISAGGADLGGTNDQGMFSYIQKTGDFDFKVRIDSLSLADAWSEAGLLAREDLTPGARSVSAMATPSISGCYFQSRIATNGATTLSGGFPVNYPNMWLRLSRVGSVFSGFAGTDGQNWTQLGTMTATMANTLYFGFAVSSHNPGQTTTAAFRDFGTVVGPGASPALSIETLGQSSRRTSLVISEIMYHPTNSLLEFVELFNSRGEPQDMSGYQLSGDIKYTFPNGTTLPGGGFLVVARSPADLQTAYGISAVLGPYTNNLPNDSGSVILLNQAGAVYLEVDYSDHAPWPVAGDGAGHSLVLARPSYGENNPAAWAASDSIGGSPGRLEPISSEPLQGVVINEFLAHTDPPLEDSIELYNHTMTTKDLSGAWLSDDITTNKYRISNGTSLPPKGFAVFTESMLGFRLNKLGSDIALVNSNRTRVIDAIRYEPQENGVSMGRVPDGGSDFYRLAARTLGTNNGPALQSSVVINEIMYDPISELDDDQYVELYNRTTNTVDLSNWSFTSGINFAFPTNTTLAANSYLVVAKNAGRLRTNYANLNFTNCFGDFGGKLSHSGERVALAFPMYDLVTNGSVVTVKTSYIDVNEVTYNIGGRWGQWSHGGGSSLELIDPDSDNRLAPNWADSDETHKAPWSIISANGTIDNGTVAADELQLLLQDVGECLVDNVQVIPPTGGNLITNSTFETGAGGWVAEGTEKTSSIENAEGYGSSKSYHLRAVEKGDNQVNRVRTLLSSSLASGTTNVTIQAAVRWLKGDPEVLLRLRGNWLECAGELFVPPNLGTPGAPNSRFITNGAPAITGVQHSPVLPAAGQSIVVTARVADPDGLSSVFLKYRLDPSGGYTTLSMTDDGNGGDAIPGDGIYTATIPGQASGTMVAFYVQATDALAASDTFPDNAPARECLVRVGEVQPTGNFPVYRIWMTQATLNSWNNALKLDNSSYDITFVLGNQRVIYNAQARYKGSPYISPGYCGATCSRCGYTMAFPADDPILGGEELVLDWPGGHGHETTALQEQMCYWIADKLNLAFSHRYTIRLHINGVTDVARQGTFEAVVQPDGDFISEWMPNDDQGQFFKIERAFEFTDAGTLSADPEPRLQVFTTTGGVKKREKYRWNFMFRSTGQRDNYTNIFALVDAVNSPQPEPYTSSTFGMADVEQWMRIFATEHIIVNFDAYGHQIGKNMYAYLPQAGKWQLYMFDLDWAMLPAQFNNSSYAPLVAPLFNTDDPTIATMYAFPPIARAYWRAIQDAVNGPLLAANCNPVMDAKYASLLANGITWCDGAALTDPSAVKTWFSQRRSGLLTQLANVAAPFSVNASVTISNGVGIVTGTAPIGIYTIWLNGVQWPVTWTSVTNWVALVPLQAGSNFLSIAGLDTHGQPVGGTSNGVSVVYGGTVPSPVGAVVLNEIMFNPTIPDAEYVELFNTSSNYTFDLSGWDFNGLAYTFPNGALIAPRSFLTLAKNRQAFDTAYGPRQVFDEYGGNLQLDGETLSLIKPPAVVVDRVRYETNAPWSPPVPGASLQLIDAAQDNSRVGNWVVVQTNSTVTPQWVFASTNVTATSSRLYIYLLSAGDIYVDDIKLVAGSVPEVGPNFVTDGDFETPLGTTWNLTANFAGSTTSTATKHGGTSSLHVIATAAGSGSGNAIYEDLATPLTNGATYTISFWYLQTTNGGPLVLRLSGASVFPTFNVTPPVPLAAGPFTPGATNSIATNLPPFPTLWLNELQAENLTGPTDNFSERDPWVEIYNAGATTQSLAGLYLGTNGAPTQWAFPGNASIAPGQFLLVWLDGQTGQTAGTNLHTSFRSTPGNGSVLLSRIVSNAVQVVDYLNYSALPANYSYGDFPDGQPFYRQAMFKFTPAATNNISLPPISVSINEWMADNATSIVDPATSSHDDWFEIYNPSNVVANLAGYFLTDTLTNQFQFQIPAGYTIPPHGFLLVWADSKSSANTNASPDLHVNFKLDKAGEAIGLFAPDGTAVDAITFGPQTTDVSEGRFPDGGPSRVFMTTATPRTNNIVPNTAPILAPIANKALIVGQTLSFTASATDIDLPPQILTYSLAPGAPGAASINPSTGQFTWAPAFPRTNTISIVVADNGTPSLSATQTFTVTVYLPPKLTSVSQSGGELTFSWQAPAGLSYQVEYKDDLTALSWTPIGSPLFGNGGVLSFAHPLSPQRRFFRLRILP
jgi:hypothetical protein